MVGSVQQVLNYATVEALRGCRADGWGLARRHWLCDLEIRGPNFLELVYIVQWYRLYGIWYMVNNTVYST